MLKKGDLIKSIGGDWHEVLKVEGPGMLQDPNSHPVFHHPSHTRDSRTKSVVTIWDGLFSRKHSIEEIDKLYTEIRGLESITYKEELLLT